MGKQARSGEDQFWAWRNSKCLNDRVSACDRTFNRAIIKRITLKF
jgi:hypothetical protein